MENIRRLLAIDPSLTCSGWALFSLSSSKVCAVGKIKGEPPGQPLSIRLRILHEKVDELFDVLKLRADDLLTCESATTMRDPHAALKVEQVRSIFESNARSRGVCVPGRVNPRSVHFEVMGLRGPQVARDLIKEAARRVARHLFSEDLTQLGFPIHDKELKRHQDIVDALLVGRLALSRIRSAEASSMLVEEAFEQTATLRRQGHRLRK